MVDAVRALNGTGASPAPVSASDAACPADPVLAREQARRAAYDADLKKLDLLERLGLVLPTAGVRAAVTQSAVAIVRTLDRLDSLDEDLLAAARDGRPGARRFLKQLGHDLRTTMATALEKAMEMRKDEPLWELDELEVPPEALKPPGR